MAKLDRGTLISLARGLTEGKALVFLHSAASVSDGWWQTNCYYLGSWLERETHSLHLFKDIKKLIEVVPFPESQGLCPAWLWPHCCSWPACLSLFWTLLPWPCGSLLSLLWCWQVHFMSPTSVPQGSPSPSPLYEPEVFAGTAGSQRWHQSQELSLLSCWRQGFHAFVFLGVIYDGNCLWWLWGSGWLAVVWEEGAQPAGQEQTQTSWQILGTQNSCKSWTKALLPPEKI